jgi:hypothetical protein
LAGRLLALPGLGGLRGEGQHDQNTHGLCWTLMAFRRPSRML